MVMTQTNANNEAGTPLEIKAPTVNHLLPFLSVIEIAVTLGKPEEANPIPHDANKAQPNTRIGAALGSDNLSPTSCTKGMMIIADTVCETKVPTTNIKMPKIHKIAKTPSFSIFFCKALAIVTNKPDDETALPRAIPPIAKITIDQGNVLKSFVDNNPVPKNKTIGITAIKPDEPKALSICDSKHHKRMVAIVTAMM